MPSGEPEGVPPQSRSGGGGQEEQLQSWKEIATLLGRTVRTVQRWERYEGLPVRRHIHQDAATVYALVSEVQAWVSSRTATPVRERRDIATSTDPNWQVRYVKAYDALRRRTRQSVASAITDLQACLASDPDWAQAHAALAEAYFVLGAFEWCPPTEAFPQVRASAERDDRKH